MDKTTATLSFTIEQENSSPAGNAIQSGNHPLEIWIHTLQWIQKYCEKILFGWVDYLLTLIQQRSTQHLVEGNNLKPNHTKKYKEEFSRLRAKVPLIQTDTVFLPNHWNKKAASEQKNLLYIAQALPSPGDKPNVLEINSLKIFSERLPSQALGLRIEKTRRKQEITKEELEIGAHIICAYANAYTQATIMIDPRYIHSRKLISYLFAYQQIQHKLTEKKIHSEESIPSFSIRLKDSDTIPKCSPRETNTTINSIIGNDPGLKSLFQSAEISTQETEIQHASIQLSR
jgi:hypothetical protein